MTARAPAHVASERARSESRLSPEHGPPVEQKRSVDPRIVELQKQAAERKDVIGLAGGLPADELLPRAEMARALAEVQRYREGVAARNEAVGSAVVADQLLEAEKLEKRLQEAASGAAPMAPAETKQLKADGVAAGRPGSRK